MLSHTLEKNLRDTLTHCFSHQPPARALVVFDRHSPLSTLLSDAYHAVIPDAIMMDFYAATPDQVRAAIDTLSPGDLVVLVQSSSFRLNEFRFRLELFNRKLAAIEHAHLGRMPVKDEATMVDALAYDPVYYRTVGPALKEKIDKAKHIVVACEGTELVYDGPFESAKLNIGDYTGMKNRGGQFPIGEVFSEPTDLTGVNGRVKLFAFGNDKFLVQVLETPVEVVIEKGLIVDVINPPPSFTAVLDQIKTEEQLWVRELGFGMNRALTRHRTLIDVGSYERMCGIHMSLGHKHTIYAKPGFPKRSSRFHVDVFVDVTDVTIDGETVFQNGAYKI
ncbi:hypothetical protein HYV73_01220 [Candidatus Uhrbacteria bacterium]|nr:hypothetical protein [Candidatus Uhrbacteria bacterium]